MTREVRRWMGTSAAPSGERGDGAKRGGTEMICMTVDIREGALMHRALKIARDGKTSRRVRLVFPIDPEAFFVPEGSDQREAA